MINVGLIGFGRYGKKYYSHINQNNKFRIIKILRKNKKNSKVFTNNVEKFFQIKNIDLYIIASPTYSHFRYLNLAMKKNKNIIVEKPLVKTKEEFLKFKKNLIQYKKIILINHTDLYFKSFLELKNKIIEIGKIKEIKLSYGKKDRYFLKNIKEITDLPFYEWLSHPLAIINFLFKQIKFKIEVKENQINKNKFLIQKLKIFFISDQIKIKLYFSNNYKQKKRNLRINGALGSLTYRGYNKKNKFILTKKDKEINFGFKNENSIENLLNNFIDKFYKNKFVDDRKIICKTMHQLFNISKNIK